MTGPIGTAAALACLLALAACGGGGGGSSAAPGGNGGNGDPPGPVTVFAGTVIDLENLTGTPTEKSTEFNRRVRAARETEPGSNNALTMGGNGEPYDTAAYWTIDGADVTSKRAGFSLPIRQQFGPAGLSGYTFKYHIGTFAVTELDDLNIQNSDGSARELGQETVAAYTDKADSSDTDYIEFGWWRLIDLETDSAMTTTRLTVRFGSYARATSSTTTDLSGVTGTATYSGNAVGALWRATETASGQTAISNGTVSLTADFGASTISGTITALRYSPGPGSHLPVDDTWAVTLASTTFNDQGVIARGGTTTQDASAAGGYWSGAFQLGEDVSGNAVQPPAVVGQFTAQFDDGGATGAFVAKK